MPTSNAFLIINLGCEMLYVIDQRLKAQGISLEKSAQVLRDLTCVLFDQKLVVQLMNPHPCQHILTMQQCRILLTDIACCSLMRLDMTSMDKLWDLMVMLFKWQLYTIREHPNRLLELTFRHMDGAAKLMPEMKKTLLIDSTKRCLIEFWDTCTLEEIEMLMSKLLNWMEPFNVKISILIRSGFQRNDGTFETSSAQNMEHFQDYVDNIGENIYAKSSSGSKSKSRKISTHRQDDKRTSSISNELSSLANQLNISNDIVTDEPVKETEVETPDVENDDNDNNDEGKSDEAAETSSKNDLVVDDVNCSVETDNVEVESTTDSSSNSEFVHLKKTTTALQSYLKQFEMENNKTNDGSETFDATEELLKMLDKETNES